MSINNAMGGPTNAIPVNYGVPQQQQQLTWLQPNYQTATTSGILGGGTTTALVPSWQYTYGYSAPNSNQHKLFSIFNAKDELVVLIDRTGNVVFGAGARNWDEAARTFWIQLAANNPLKFHIEALQEDNKMLVDVIKQLHLEIQNLKEPPTDAT